MWIDEVDVHQEEVLLEVELEVELELRLVA